MAYLPASFSFFDPAFIGKELTPPVLATGTASVTGSTFLKSVNQLFINNTSDWAAGPGSATLDMGTARVIQRVEWRQRSSVFNTNVGNRFEGSNDLSTWTTLHTFTSSPAAGSVTTFPIENFTPFRYFRWTSGAATYYDGAYCLVYVYS